MKHLGDLIGAYLDGELEAAERARADEHLTGCGACRAEMADVALARSAVRGLPMLEPPAGLLPSPVARRHRFFRPAWAWTATATAAVALVAGLIIAPGQEATAFDIGNLVDQHVARVVVDPGISTIRGPVNGP